MTAIPLWLAIVIALPLQLSLLRYAWRNAEQATRYPPGILWLTLLASSCLVNGAAVLLAGYFAVGFGLVGFAIAVILLNLVGWPSQLSLAIHGRRTAELPPASVEALVRLYAAAMGTDLAAFRAASARPELSAGDLSGWDLPFLQVFLLMRQLTRLNLTSPLTPEQADRFIGDARAASPVAAELIEPERARAMLTDSNPAQVPIELSSTRGKQPVTPQRQEAIEQLRDRMTALTPSIIGLTAWAYRANDPIGYRLPARVRADVVAYRTHSWFVPRDGGKPSLDPAG